MSLGTIRHLLDTVPTPAWVGLTLGSLVVTVITWSVATHRLRRAAALKAGTVAAASARAGRKDTALTVASLIPAALFWGMVLAGSLHGLVAFGRHVVGWDHGWEYLVPGTLDGVSVTFAFLAFRAVRMRKNPTRCQRVVWGAALASATVNFAYEYSRSGHDLIAGGYLGLLSLFGVVMFHEFLHQFEEGTGHVVRDNPAFGLRWITWPTNTWCAAIAWRNYPPAADTPATIPAAVANLERARALKRAARARRDQQRHEDKLATHRRKTELAAARGSHDPSAPARTRPAAAAPASARPTRTARVRRTARRRSSRQPSQTGRKAPAESHPAVNTDPVETASRLASDAAAWWNRYGGLAPTPGASSAAAAPATRVSAAGETAETETGAATPTGWRPELLDQTGPHSSSPTGSSMTPGATQPAKRRRVRIAPRPRLSRLSRRATPRRDTGRHLGGSATSQVPDVRPIPRSGRHPSVVRPHDHAPKTGLSTARDRMWQFWLSRHTAGHTPCGAELDKYARTNNYGRRVLREWLDAGQISRTDFLAAHAAGRRRTSHSTTTK